MSTQESRLPRRDFLRITALAAVTTVIAACGGNAGNNSTTGSTGQSAGSKSGGSSTSTSTSTGGSSSTGGSTGNAGATAPGMSATSPMGGSTVGSNVDVRYVKGLKYNGTLKESPVLAEMVKSGKLPPVEKRLPENPYVVPHNWLKPGKYGGQMQWITSDKSDWNTTHLVQESMYGHSPLRWLHDGREVGPGLAESWESNKDLSMWTLHFRKGLRWSDGEPWTVDDILFWWEDEVGVKELNQLPPADLRSGKGTPAKMKKIDDYTLQVIFDAPTPIAAQSFAKYVKRGEGAWWMDPKHYLKQFHIKYNPKLDKKKWVNDFNSKLDWATNPDNPTMTGWKLKSYQKGQSSVWERNPYYWCVDKQGNQLPFIDGITMTNVQDPQAMRLAIQQGKADWVHGAFNGLSLADVSTFKQSQAKTKLELDLWDSGSGTASIMFFNYDYYEPKMRKLIREPNFRKALSHAFNREAARKAIYFNQGEITTGTYGPKAIESIVGIGPKIHSQWMNDALKYDPALAKKMLDDLGVKDVNGDGWREMPDGSRLHITLDYSAGTADEHVHKDEMLANDWKAIGINAEPNPLTPTSRGDKWAAGQSLSYTDWELSALGGLISTEWLVPMESSRWAPLEGQYWAMLGSGEEDKEQNLSPWKRHPPRMKPEPGGPVDQLWKLFARAKVETDTLKRNQLVWQMFKVHIKYGPFFQGTVENYPQIELIRQGLMNVPRRNDLTLHGFTNPWHHPTPAVYDPESWFWDNPEEHS